MSAIVETKRDNYGLKMLLLIGVLFAIMVLMFEKIHNAKEPITQNIIMPVVTDKPIYILKSYATAITYQKNGLDKGSYTSKLNRFDKYIRSMGYKTEFTQEDKISSLPTEAILFIPDAIALSGQAKESVKNFLSAGGNLFFNYSSGFSDEKGNYIGNDFVKDITHLRLRNKSNFINFKDGIFLTQKMLSPLTNSGKGTMLEASVYDPVPIFKNLVEQDADIVMTNYDQTNPPIAKSSQSSFASNEAGVAWHGYYGKGKWFYMSFPSYIFYDSVEVKRYKELLNAIINYLSQDEVIEKFPYVDSDKIVFISEDTEYKFENFKKFSDLSQKYKIPVTAFIVTSLAQKPEYQDMMKKISSNPYMEFGSHSHMHKKIIGMDPIYVKQETADTKKILDGYSKSPIVGFRPPREELDDAMKNGLDSVGFKYILNVTDDEKFLYPKFLKKHPNLLLLPRHGTDDYSYLINLDWDRSQIVEQMIKETEFVTALNGIYTLSIHTHLFAYSSNIKIVEEYFKYLNSHPIFRPLDGRSITKRIKESDNIDIEYNTEGNLITLFVKNSNSTVVDNFSCKLFKNPKTKIKSIKCNETPGSKNTENPDAATIKLKHLQPNSTTTVYIEVE